MEFSHEEKRTPTYREYAKSSGFVADSKHEIIRILCNSDWRAITFVTDLFKINRKLQSSKEYDNTLKKLKKIVTEQCRCSITVRSAEKADVQLLVASDADDSAIVFDEDDFGFIKRE